MHGKNNMMPFGMDYQPEVGDIEEEFQSVINDIDPAKVLPPPVDDKAAMRSIESGQRATMAAAEFDRARQEAVMEQERADKAAAMGETRAEMGTKEDIDRLLSVDFMDQF